MSTSPVMSITDELLAELEAAAKAATPGPWSSSDAIPERSFCGQVWDAAESALLCHDKVSSQATADVQFVARANPATILALLARIAEKAERVELKRDAANHEIEFLESWLRFAGEPIGQECCGRAYLECCGNADPVYRPPEEVTSAMAARHAELIAAMQEVAP